MDLAELSKIVEEIRIDTLAEVSSIDFAELEKHGIYKGTSGWSINYPGTLYLDKFSKNYDLSIPDEISNLFISLPFCSRRCTFCTIISDSSPVGREEYFKALFKEMRFYKKSPKTKVKYIDLGGGTASLLTPNELDSLLTVVKDCFELEDNPHICLEAHPELIHQQNRTDLLSVARKHKIPNIAFGVQTFDDQLLSKFNRGHGVEDVKKAVSFAKKYIPSFSFDLIVGIDGQDMESVGKTICETLLQNPGSIDLYTYVNSHLSLNNSSDNKRSFIMTLFFLNSFTRLGWYPHRISADVIVFKKSRDMNSIKSALEGLGSFGHLNLLGVGSGAFSFLKDFHAVNPYDINKYISNVESNNVGFSLYYKKDAKDLFYNYVKDSLRRHCTLDISKISKIFAFDFVRHYRRIIGKLVSLGLITYDEDKMLLRLTKLGFIYSDKVISFFFPTKYFEDYFALEKKVNNSHLKEFHEEICNSPFNFELTPEIHSFIRKQRS